MSKMMLTIVCLLWITGTMAQSKADFYGAWKVSYGQEKEQLSLKKTNSETLDYPAWGRFFEFHEDGTYSEYASAPCGLDDNHYHYTGKWSYNDDKGIIELTEIKVQNDRPEIYNNYKVLSSGNLKVISFTAGEAKIKVAKSWEVVTEKN